MRIIASATLSAAMLTSAACSDPECGDNEQKIGKTCFPLVKHDADAATGTSAAQASASPAQTNGGDAGEANRSGLDAGSGLDGGASGTQSSPIASDSQVPVHTLDPSMSAQNPMSPQSAPPPCDGGLVNVCNGCEMLTHAIGEVCSNGGQGPCALMGTYQCFAEQLVCNAPKGMASAEVCDGVDNDCNGKTDEGLLNACKTCGSVPAEVCDGVDNNCDGKIDEGVLNACKKCGPVPAEVCDGVDNNCDGQIDEGLLNACKQCGPVPAEVCDGVDNDCDGQTDEADSIGIPTWYPDCDGDGYGVPQGSVRSCAKPQITTACKAFVQTTPVPKTTLDCNDSSSIYHPGASNHGSFYTETGYSFDLNCDGSVGVSSYVQVAGSMILPYCANPTGEMCEAQECVRLVNAQKALVSPTITDCGKSLSGRVYANFNGAGCDYGETTAQIYCL